jgi:hypothetical protein
MKISNRLGSEERMREIYDSDLQMKNLLDGVLI